MIKREIDIFDYAGDILKNIQKGALLVSKAGNRVNAMTIGWGSIGVEWARPIFTAYVREHRFTAGLLKKGDSFTVCVPLDKSPKSVLGFMGKNSGRVMDKIKQSGLTLVEGEAVSTPAVKEFPVTLECKLAQYQLQDKSTLNERYMNMYPQDVASDFSGSNRDFHIAFIGEIVKAYIIEE